MSNGKGAGAANVAGAGVALSLIHILRAFAEGADQADDITLLVLRYDGQENGPAASSPK